MVRLSVIAADSAARVRLSFKQFRRVCLSVEFSLMIPPWGKSHSRQIESQDQRSTSFYDTGSSRETFAKIASMTAGQFAPLGTRIGTHRHPQVTNRGKSQKSTEWFLVSI